MTKKKPGHELSEILRDVQTSNVPDHARRATAIYDRLVPGNAQRLYAQLATPRDAASAELLRRMEAAQEQYEALRRSQERWVGVASSDSISRLNQSYRQQAREAARDKAAQRSRDEQVIASLDGIHGVLKGLVESLQRHEAKLQEHEKRLIRLRTGAPGRPGSKHLVVEEFKRRALRSEVEKSLADQARVLAQWLSETHPEAHPITPRTIENVLRVQHRTVWGKKAKRRGKTR